MLAAANGAGVTDLLTGSVLNGRHQYSEAETSELGLWSLPSSQRKRIMRSTCGAREGVERLRGRTVKTGRRPPAT